MSQENRTLTQRVDQSDFNGRPAAGLSSTNTSPRVLSNLRDGPDSRVVRIYKSTRRLREGRASGREKLSDRDAGQTIEGRIPWPVQSFGWQTRPPGPSGPAGKIEPMGEPEAESLTNKPFGSWRFMAEATRLRRRGLLGQNIQQANAGPESAIRGFGEVEWNMEVAWAEGGNANAGGSEIGSSSSSRGMAIAHEAKNGTRNPTSLGASPLDPKSTLACGRLTPPVLARLRLVPRLRWAAHRLRHSLAVTCPPELGRHASPGSRSGSPARRTSGTPTGSTSPGSASYRREARGASPL